MKRILATLLAAVLLLGCASAMAEVDKAAFTPFTNTVVLDIARNDTFNFYGHDEEWTSVDDNKWLDVMKEYLNIEFNHLWVTEQDEETYNTKWNLAMASGELPDFGGVNRIIYEALVEAGQVADMSEYYEKYASERVKALVEGSPELGYMTRDGKLLGFPCIRPSMDNYDTLVIRKDWMDAVGVTEMPKTIDEMIELGKKFVDAKLGGEHTYALCVDDTIDTNWGKLTGYFQGYGVGYAKGYWSLNEETGELYYGRTDERMKDALLRLQGLYKDGLIKEDYLVTSAQESFTAGECGIIYSVCWGPVNAVDLYALDEKLELVACDAPTLDGSKVNYCVNAVPNRFYFVSVDATDEEKIAFVQSLNLAQELFSDFDYDWGYHRGAFPYTPGDQMESAFQYAKYYDEIEHAYTTGDTDSFLSANGKTYYERLKAFEAGDRTLGKYHGIYRVPGGTYNIINTAMKEDRVHNSFYQSAPTESMMEYQDMLDELLTNAENQVIMGADISVWEKAVEEWFQTGGQDMTDDANAWYASNK